MIIIFILSSIISFYALFLHIKMVKGSINERKEFLFEALCMFFTSWVSVGVSIWALFMSIELMLGG